MGEKIRILLIEDNPGDVRLIKEILSPAKGGFEITAAEKLGDGLKLLSEKSFDLLLLDLGLPDSQGLETLDKARAHAPEIPIVVFTGLADEAVGFNAIHRGAQDYLFKRLIDSSLLVRSLRYAIERKHIERRIIESEERYRNIIETAMEGVLLINAEAVIIFANNRIAEMFGYTVDELLGKRLSEFMADKTGTEADLFLERRSKGIKKQHDIRFRRKDGADLWAIASTSALFDKKGQYVGILGMITDITARRQAEESLRESENKLSAITRTAADAIILIDDEGKVCFWNLAAERILGYSAEEVIEKNITLIIPDRYREAHTIAFSRFAKTGEGPLIGKTYEVFALKKGGAEIPVELSISGIQ